MLTLYLYLLITQIVSGDHNPATVYFRYTWLICIVIALHSRQYSLTKRCNQAFSEIQDAKHEIIMMITELDHSNSEVLQMAKTLKSLLGSAKPLNGNGYFKVLNTTQTSVAGALTTYLVVLIQFSITERGGLSYKTA